jgi:hypothetical protein
MIDHAGAIEIVALLFLVVLRSAVRIPFDGCDVAITQRCIAGRTSHSRRHQSKTCQYQGERPHRFLLSGFISALNAPALAIYAIRIFWIDAAPSHRADTLRFIFLANLFKTIGGWHSYVAVMEGLDGRPRKLNGVAGRGEQRSNDGNKKFWSSQTSLVGNQ